MNVHGSSCCACEEEDTAAETSASCAELGRDEVKPSQRHRVLRTRRRETLQCMSLFILPLLLLVMVVLCNRADHYIFILFLSSSSFFFFPRLISVVGDWTFTILWHMVWP